MATCVPVRPGGDVALASAALKRLIERGAVDDRFVADHTEGFAEARDRLAEQDLDHLLGLAGVDGPTLGAFVDELVRAGGAVHVWSMGAPPITAMRPRACGASSTWPWPRGRGRDGVGLMPIRGHRACRAAPGWGPTPRRCPGRPSIPSTPRPWRGTGASRCPTGRG